jgi:uncharacterized protein
MCKKKNQQPFIKKFNDSGFHYVYDVNTNQVIEVEKPVYDLLDYYGKESLQQLESRFQDTYDLQTIRNSFSEIKNARVEMGLLSNSRPKKCTMGISSEEGIKQIHQIGLKQLILEVTKECNLHCAYCRTSGKYAPHNDSHTFMTMETCQQAIDFFCQRTGSREEAHVTFYGGEPLLRYSFIKEAVNYVKRKEGKTKYSFNLTTNGTLLNKEIVRFIIENDFSVLVSIDGPETINDRYRLLKNGEGTFKQIMQNLEYIKQCDSTYFKNRIGISCVMAPPYDNITDTLDFFSTNEILKPIRHQLRSSAVNDGGTNFYEDHGLTESHGLEALGKIFGNRLRQALLNRNLECLTMEKKMLYNILHNLARRPINRPYEYIQPFGNCHIGLRRLFVGINGIFNICERVSDEYRIGSAQSGFDYKKIADYYKKLDLIMQDCTDCFAMNHCERCWATIGYLERFEKENKDRYCSLNRNMVEKALKFYTQMLREDPDCMESFGEVEIA